MIYLDRSGLTLQRSLVNKTKRSEERVDEKNAICLECSSFIGVLFVVCAIVQLKWASDVLHGRYAD